MNIKVTTKLEWCHQKDTKSHGCGGHDVYTVVIKRGVLHIEKTFLNERAMARYLMEVTDG